MIILNDYDEFYWRIRLMDVIDLEPYGILPCLPLGEFEPCRLGELVAICKKHPELHIVTVLDDGIWVNRVERDGLAFHLGKGAKDPRLYFCRYLECGLST